MHTQEILQRLHLILDTENNFQLSKSLGFSRGAIDGWLRRNSTPYEACFRAYQQTGVSMEWLLTGKGAQEKEVAPKREECGSRCLASACTPEMLQQCLEKGLEEALNFGMLRVTDVDQKMASRLIATRVLCELQNGDEETKIKCHEDSVSI